MRVNRCIVLFQFFAFLQIGLIPSLVWAACNPVPEIINELPRLDKGWSGSVAWYNNKIYEITGGVSYAAITNPATGATEGYIQFGNWIYKEPEDPGGKGLTYDPFRGTFWCNVGITAYEVRVTGGDAINSFPLNHYWSYGIWKDPEERNAMWVADPVNKHVVKVDIRDGSVLKVINTGFNVRGVARVNNNLWCVRAGEQGDDGVVIKIDMQGNELCRYVLTKDGECKHDAGGCDISPDGHLWIEGGKDTWIYQLDIGYIPEPPTPIPPTPSPIPTRTPVFIAPPVIDSGDYDGDGTSDIAIFRNASGLWAVRDLTRIYYGRDGDTPAPGDYNGDGTTDLGLYRDSIGLWMVRGITRSYFGGGEDISVPGDYDGDGICDLSIFRPSSGLWAVKSVTRTYFGSSEDIPVPLYYGESMAKYMAIYRPGSGLWAIRGLGRAYFGEPGDQPVPADYDGLRGGTDIGIFRGSSGLWAIRGVTRVYFGRAGDQAVPGSYRGNNISDMGIFRSSSGFWGIRNLTRTYFGGANDIPVSGRVPEYSIKRQLIDSSDYNGDGTDDIAVFKPETGVWAIRGISRVYFGRSDDIPTPGDYSGAGTTMLSVYRSTGRLWTVRNLTRVYFDSELIGLPVPSEFTGDGICDMAFFNDGFWTIRIQFPIPHIFKVQFGRSGDQPVPGNYDGGDSESLAIFRPSNGLWVVRDLTRIYFGGAGDIGMPADYNGDGDTDPAVYRPKQGRWIVKNITNVYFKNWNGAIPVSADFDGDGTEGMALFHPSDGLWQIHDFSRLYFGGDADLPVSGFPDV